MKQYYSFFIRIVFAVFAVSAAVVLFWPAAYKAPDFDLPVIGGGRTVSEFPGNITVVHFWYPSCPGCREEVPEWNALAARYAQTSEVRFVGILLPYDSEETIRQFMRAHGIPFLPAIDSGGGTASAYGIQAAPVSFIVDQQGRVVWKKVGKADFEMLRSRIDELLAAARERDDTQEGGSIQISQRFAI